VGGELAVCVCPVGRGLVHPGAHRLHVGTYRACPTVAVCIPSTDAHIGAIARTQADVCIGTHAHKCYPPSVPPAVSVLSASSFHSAPPPPSPLQDIPEFPPEVKPVVLTPGAAARYPCPLPGCDATLKSRFCLRRHWRSHTGEKPFACDVPGCGRSYGHKQSLQYVLRRPVCHCPLCVSFFVEEGQWAPEEKLACKRVHLRCTIPRILAACVRPRGVCA
jgi:hypothetical protein